MMLQKDISISISRAVISLFLLLTSVAVSAQQSRRFAPQEDTIPTFRGLQVMVDLVGPIQKAVSDYGQYEAGLKVNIKDKYFPVIEVGYGIADHAPDAVTNISYKTKAPYGRIGIDFNVLKNKHDIYRFYVGLRYAFTSYKFDVGNSALRDPLWQDDAGFYVEGVKANLHWGELVAGVDATIWGPVHLGWSVRYKRRLAHNDGDVGNTWYVPGYGKTGTTRFGATFHVIFEF